MTTPVYWTRERRMGGLRRFAVAITALNVFGYTVLGFEQPWIVPFVVLPTAYALELALEAADAWACARRPKFLGGLCPLVDFLLPAHISALAVGMLLYANERLGVVVFATAVAIASKAVFRVPMGPVSMDGRRATRHFFNPSNFAISVTLLLFPWVGGAPPYQFVENVAGSLDVLLPLVVVLTGSLLNTRFTGRMPLALAWAGAFVAQAVSRAVLNGTPWEAGLAPMTGLAFVLYTFYMVTDPGTTPEQPRHQVAFGAGVAVVYGLFVQTHHVFGFYYALTIVSGIRGLWLGARAWIEKPAAAVDAAAGSPVGAVAAVAPGGLAAAWRWPASLQPRPWEYRWRALPLFLSQGVAIGANAWLTGSLAMPTSRLALLSVVLGAVGVSLRVWAVGLISAPTMSSMRLCADRLVTRGVYGLVRHPVYLGDLLLFLGYGLFLTPVAGIGFVAFHVIRTLRLIAFEEPRLASQLGLSYLDYRRAVPMLWPRLVMPPPAPVRWREGIEASTIWIGLAAGYVAVWRAGDVWAITPFEAAGFLFAAVYFSRARRVVRNPVGA